MNIIKFKDQIKEGDELFNTLLKGKYAYWVHMRWVVPFSEMTSQEYVYAENSRRILSDKIVWDTFEDKSLLPFIDERKTEEANNPNAFLRLNEFSTDADITLEELKKFRTWLATSLLLFDIQDENCVHVLEYYKGGMYDDVVKWLGEYGKDEYALMDTKTSSCGCGADLSSLYSLSGNICDALSIYRKNIYNAMCEYFGNLDFWDQFTTELFIDFKKYIDNILKSNLQLSRSTYMTTFVDCPCVDNTNEEAMKEILRKLSIALGYIIDGDMKGHLNFISTAFLTWAQNLYELMEWV